MRLLKKLPLFLFSALLSAVIFLSTCETPMGMGEPIDWEPPVLTLDPVSNPLYARLGTTLSGTVTDNKGVDHIVFLDQATGKELFPVTLISGGGGEPSNWTIALAFTPEQNNQKIIGQIIAYDKAGNSGAMSMVFVTMIIDIKPPLIEHIEIKRTDSRISKLEPYRDLKALETSDPLGNRKADILRYQNGWFYINAIVSDEETKIESISLEIYDTTAPDTMLLSLNVDEGYSQYFPRWTVKEEDIINAGVAKLQEGADYKLNYYQNDARYYYRVVVRAIDKSENESEVVEEDEGYMCLWAKSDKPKGIIDPGTGTSVSGGTKIPIDIIDDDTVVWAYAGLLTYDQWYGNKLVGVGLTIPNGTDEYKLNWLKEKLKANIPIYNYRYDKYNGSTTEQIKDIVTNSNGLDETLIYILTSNSDADHGDYVLFTIIGDKKLAPHTGTGPEWTNTDIWAGNATPVQVIDENVPLIVFDTTAGCPEENTFPKLTGSPEEKYFNIVGYTLRESSSGAKVITFRMAWIPYDIGGKGTGKPDNYIPSVQAALRNNSGYPNGVQYWEFKAGGGGEYSDFTESTEMIDGRPYKKQSFSKKFSVMNGDIDDKKTSYKNFFNTVTGEHENETKLFIFYALDDRGHEVFRQLRLLGYKEVPSIFIYDISNKPSINLPGSLPNPTEYYDPLTGGPTEAYYTALKTYNDTTNVISALKGGYTPGDSEAESFSIYPRGTTVKYYITTAKSGVTEGKMPIQSVVMKDITFSTHRVVGSNYNATNKELTFCENYPDVTQRTFEFEITDKLNNKRIVQRTVAISNAAKLERITTTSQNGTYGHGTGAVTEPTVITLKAEFSGLIYIGTTQKPRLIVRHQTAPSNNYVYTALTCKTNATKNSPVTALEFDFTVPLDATGKLETMYANIGGGATDLHPLQLEYDSYTVTILDAGRDGAPAFIPGYETDSVTMPNWQNADYTLQGKKNILLNGVHPKLVSVSWGGKTPYTAGNYYFKNGEAIELTVQSDKEIRASGASTIQYQIKDKAGTLHPTSSPYYYSAEFKYQKPGTEPDAKKKLIYSLTVNSTSCPSDGELVNARLNTTGYKADGTAGGHIVDDYDNTIVDGSVIVSSLLPAGTHIYIKKAVPSAPPATLNGSQILTAPVYYNGSVITNIPLSSADRADWEDHIQYSEDSGVTWDPSVINASNQVTSAVSKSLNTPGSHGIRVRYVDRAGNEGAVASKSIQINDTFPSLVSVNVAEANGYYNGETGRNSLTFNLNFADIVTVTTPANVSITVRDRDSDSASPMKVQTITTNLTAGTVGTTVTFKMNIPSGPVASGSTNAREMLYGVYISNVSLAGLTDKYVLTGSTGNATCTAANNGTPGNPSVISLNGCPNLTSGVFVDNVTPDVSVYSPAKADSDGVSGDKLVKTITLTFREAVIKGSGTITIRPRGSYAIPPVLTDSTGYYLGYTSDGTDNASKENADGTGYPAKFKTAGPNRTYIQSFYDIYNAVTDATLRGYLTKGASMTNVDLNIRTGQSFGPYIRTTHGLVNGAGYLGGPYTSADAPNLATSGSSTPIHSAMIPDKETKWVLDYNYPINSTSTAVANIRTALNSAKWRWQEIDVANSAVSVGGTGANLNKMVTITLNEPLLKGLEWDVFYPAGTFADMAGNSAPAESSGSNYWFTTPGVQAPVVRVNRRSYDGRTSEWQSTSNGGNTYANPTSSKSWDINTTDFAVNGTNGGANGDAGWGMGNFETVHYRVESESPGATISALVFKGSSGNRSSVTGGWSGTITGSSPSRSWDQNPPSNTAGEWVLSNMVLRSNAGSTTNTYTIYTKNGTSEKRTFAGNFTMFRSYNRDLTASELGYPAGDPGTGLSGTATITNGQGIITYGSLEASKSYIVATAEKSSQKLKGVEGVFRTVIALNYRNTAYGNSGLIFVQGSNLKNGMPSVAGFPVQDANESGDRRTSKAFYRETTGTDRTRYYWVSTEIVCEWYFLSWISGGSHMNEGEANNYLTVGYGDLTYGIDVNNYSQ
jgi:hypothetical protein